MTQRACWAVTAPDGRHGWVTNFGDGTVSLYAIGDDGSLSSSGEVGTLPAGAVGLASS